MKKTFSCRFFILSAIAICLLSFRTFAQDNPNLEQGMKPYGDFNGGNIDAVDLGSGGLSFSIDLWKVPQRGSMQLPYTLRYNSKMWSNTILCGVVLCAPNWQYGTPDSAGIEGDGYGNGSSTSNSPIYLTVGAFSHADCMLRYYNWSNGMVNLGPVDCTAYSPDGAGHTTGRLTSTLNYDAQYVTIDDSAISVNSAVTLDPTTNEPVVLAETIDRNGISSFLGQNEDPDGNLIDFIDYDNNPSLSPLGDTRGLAIPSMSGTTTDYSLCGGSGQIVSASTLTFSGPAGAPQPSRFTFCYAQLTLTTNFPNPSGTTIAQFSNRTNNQIYALQSVALPTGDKWIFAYDSYGDVTKITFPTGASLSYQWGTYSMCSDLTALNPNYTESNLVSSGWTPESRFVTSRTLDANDGTGPHQWLYTWSPEMTNVNPRYFKVTVTDPAQNDTVHTETGLSNSCSYYETNEQSYQGSSTSGTGTLLQTITTFYNSILSPSNNINWMTLGSIDAAEVKPYEIQTTIPFVGPNGATNLVKTVNKTYDPGVPYYVLPWDATSGSGPYTTTYGTVSLEKESDFSGNIVRQTKTTYMRDVDPTDYQLRPDLVNSVQVLDGNNTQYSYTQYGYDEVSLASSGISTNHTTLLLPVSEENNPLTSARGHQTTETKTVNLAGATIQSCKTYYDSGMLATSTDWLSSAAHCAGANVTSYTYNSTYVGAFRTMTRKPTTANGQTHTVSGTYDFATGLLSSFTDENSVVSNYFYNDSLGRMTSAHRATSTPAETWITFSYPSLTEIDSSQDQNSVGDGALQKKSFYDGVGRILHSKVVSDPAGTAITDTTYDNLGHVYSTSNPYRNNTDSSNGLTTYTYDALGRKVLECHPDNGTGSAQCAAGASYLQWSYNGNVVTSYDESRNAWQQTSDALGRLIQVVEPGGASTYYTYNLLDNLTCAAQDGGSGGTFTSCTQVASSWRPRTFSYDYLSRLITATNPETGTVCYGTWTSGNCSGGYDGNGNLKAKTDARLVTVSYSYDALNRLLSKSYSDGITPYSCFQYDTAPVYPKPRLSAEWTVPGSQSQGCAITGGTRTTSRTILAYDAMGRVRNEQQCTPNASGPGNCTTSSPSPFALSYFYDLAGNPTAYTNGVSNVPNVGTISFGLGYDGAGRLQNLNSSWDPSSSSSGVPLSLFTADPANAYTPFGAIQNMVLGNNIFVNKTYDNRLRTTTETATHP